MPSWNDILNEISHVHSPDGIDIIRRKYLKSISDATGRNTIAYYSSFLQKPGAPFVDINDDDRNALMSVVYKMDRSKGLDLILHTPGGSIAATESIVDYLGRMFGNDVRAIIPQIAMSAGTMIACSCKSIIMGKQSNLGPIDPKYNGISTYGVIEEFERAKSEIAKDPRTIPIWQTIMGKYNPAFIGDCEKAIQWSNTIVTNWLSSNMLKDNPDLAATVVKHLSDHSETLSHERHIHIDECRRLGLVIESLEDMLPDRSFQDRVLSTHHSYMLTFSSTSATKIVENQFGTAVIKLAN
ncbi:MAG: ATP-dependent Clp protease proteolytic subunit [Methanomassiliicoccales archaeon]|nr:ATP-dependent Clp protease proteolytic subunit [Methanomassiliicoccales archaeon]